MRVLLVDKPGAQQTTLRIGQVGVARSSPDYAPLRVMNEVLGGLFSSRINLNLREEHGYTYGAGSQFVFRKNPGPFVIYGGINTPVTGPAVAEIFKEVGKMTTSAMTADALTLARDSIVRSLPSDFETSNSTAAAVAGLYLYDLGLDYYAKLPGAINAVTADAALAAAKKYLTPGTMVIVAVGDRAKIEGGLRALNLGKVEFRNLDGTVRK